MFNVFLLINNIYIYLKSTKIAESSMKKSLESKIHRVKYNEMIFK